jgi:hypothetical protein
MGCSTLDKKSGAIYNYFGFFASLTTGEHGKDLR